MNAPTDEFSIRPPDGTPHSLATCVDASELVVRELSKLTNFNNNGEVKLICIND